MATSKDSPSTFGMNVVGKVLYSQGFDRWHDWMKIHTDFINMFNDLTGCENEDPEGAFCILANEDGTVSLLMEVRSKKHPKVVMNLSSTL